MAGAMFVVLMGSITFWQTDSNLKLLKILDKQDAGTEQSAGGGAAGRGAAQP